jgi:hypothetical protein
VLSHELGHQQRKLPDGHMKSYKKVIGNRFANLNTPNDKTDPHWDSYQMHPSEVEANLHALHSYYNELPKDQRMRMSIEDLFKAVFPKSIADVYLRNRRYFLKRLSREGIVTKEMIR